MKKLLFTLFTLFTLSIFTASAQDTTCVVCTKPVVTAVIIAGNDLGVGWNNDWFWGTGCSKHIVVIINGVEYLPNPNMGHGNATSSQSFPGIVPSLTTPICVVVRNYCNQNLDSYYVDSDPVCVTPPTTAANSTVICNCVGNPTKYVISKPGAVNRCVTKKECLRKITQGWTSSCNCQ